MFDISLLTDNCILICPNNVKTYLLKYLADNNPSLRVKYISKKELFDGVSFTYGYDALMYLHKNHNLNFVNADEALANLIDKEYSTDKTKLVNSYFKELKDNNLLSYNSLFKNLFINKKVYVYEYYKDDIELTNCLNKVTSNPVYLDDVNKTYSHNYFEFETMEEEVSYVFNDIMSKIKDGMDINKIHLMNYPSDYEFLIKKYVYYLNLPFVFNENTYLFNSPIYKRFISLLESNDIETSYELLKQETIVDPLDAIGRIANVVNKTVYLNLEKEEFISLINYVASKTTLKKIKFDKAITVVDENDIIDEEDIVYVLGFSLGSYPKINKDTDFYSDIEKKEIGLNSSQTLSLLSEKRLINFITNTKNLVITFKKKIGKTVFYPSLLIEKLNIANAIKEKNNKRYSVKLSEIECAISKDNNRIFGVKDIALDTYEDNKIRYMMYDHSFKELTKDFSNEELYLSYSKINEYYHCPFQYFIKRVLKENIFEDRFDTELGNLFHKILQDSVTKKIDLKDYQKDIDEKFTSAKDKFFINMLLPQVLDVINKNNEFLTHSFYNNVIAEDELETPIDSKTILKGKIDKILFDNEDKSLAVVDYKTGGFYFDPNKLKYGLDLQLPIYSYLLRNKYPNYYNLGMYIQNICRSKKDLLNEKEKPYLLTGLTVNNESKIFRFDTSLGTLQDENGKKILSSLYISGIKVNSKGELNSKKVIDEETYNNFESTAINKIKEAIKEIRKGNFAISPIYFINDKKGLNSKSICDFCGCKDICFIKDKDKRVIDLKESEE